MSRRITMRPWRGRPNEIDAVREAEAWRHRLPTMAQSTYFRTILRLQATPAEPSPELLAAGAALLRPAYRALAP